MTAAEAIYRGEKTHNLILGLDERKAHCSKRSFSTITLSIAVALTINDHEANSLHSGEAHKRVITLIKCQKDECYLLQLHIAWSHERSVSV